MPPNLKKKYYNFHNNYFKTKGHFVFDLLVAAGWPVIPIIFCSILSLAIVFERIFTLKSNNFQITNTKNTYAKRLSSVIENANLSNKLVTVNDLIFDELNSIEVELSKYLTTLGTIATMAPLLGLLGTIIGMIEIFGATTSTGMADPSQLAHGISVALYNAAFGIIVAIPSLAFYRYFKSLVNDRMALLEKHSNSLLNINAN